MKAQKYLTKESVLKHAQEMVGIPLGKIDKTGRLSTGKGAIGNVIEESWFDYAPNSESQPDFVDAGVELKATPYIRRKNEIKAKERLVCNIINYMTEYQKTFYTSDFWHKCETILIMSYEYKKDIPKADFTIDKAVLFSFPKEDLVIIEHDWEVIIEKVKSGKAHLLTEGDTLYLAACTKGATSQSVRQQPFNAIPAKQRAYSLKASYMTRILNTYIFGNEEDERIIKDWHDLIENGFEEIIAEKLRLFYGRSVQSLVNQFGITSCSKNMNEILLSKMLGIRGTISKTAEFQNANIVPKTIRVQRNGRIKESMSFPSFKFEEIIQEDWEDSQLRTLLEPTKFLFVIFKEQDTGEYFFERALFWNMPAEDLDEVRRVWERTVKIIREGVVITKVGNRTLNNLPKRTESYVAHVRPHARDANDTYALPDGRELTKQCFWLNNSYVEDIIRKTESVNPRKALYREIREELPCVAEETLIDKYQKELVINIREKR